MTEQEAKQILGISCDSESQNLTSLYQRQREKLEEKIVKAPTPGLKAKYRDSLARLSEAYELLVVDDDGGDLPTLRRIEKPEPQPSISSLEDSKIEVTSQKAIVDSASNRSRSILVRSLSGLVCVILAIGVTVWWQNIQNEAAKTKGEIEAAITAVQNAINHEQWEQANLALFKLERICPSYAEMDRFKFEIKEGQNDQIAQEQMKMAEQMKKLEEAKLDAERRARAEKLQADLAWSEAAKARKASELSAMKASDELKKNEQIKSAAGANGNAGQHANRSEYQGYVGRLAAKFALDWHSNGDVTGEYWHPTRNPSLRYKLVGSNVVDGELTLKEFTNDDHTATIILKKQIVSGIVEWSGMMNNLDGRKLRVSFKR